MSHEYAYLSRTVFIQINANVNANANTSEAKIITLSQKFSGM